jgi:toxin ParE1/3/4
VPPAGFEARAARDWYDEASRGLGAEFIDELWRTIEQIRRWPALAPRLALEGVSDEVRHAPLRRFPFGVIYVVFDDILWVGGGARPASPWLLARPRAIAGLRVGFGALVAAAVGTIERGRVSGPNCHYRSVLCRPRSTNSTGVIRRS